MQGKTVIVTGASSGIGKATATALSQQGARIILICRCDSKGRAAMREITSVTGNPQVDLLLCDFASQRQIRRVANEILMLTDRLDVLVNNVGVIVNKRTLTEDGLEMTFAVNHLGYFLLTNLLLELLRSSDKARVVNVAADAHAWVKQFDFDNLQGEKNYSQWQVYALSKLCNILFTYELARRLQNTAVTVNCLHPGLVATNFLENAGWKVRTLSKVVKYFLLGAEKGSSTSVYLATSPKVEGITGQYFENCKPVRTSALSYDESLAKRLWEVSEQFVNQTLKA
jgi:retinol dehydrogenase 14